MPIVMTLIGTKQGYQLKNVLAYKKDALKQYARQMKLNY
jgi:hypothetical protein